MPLHANSAVPRERDSGWAGFRAKAAPQAPLSMSLGYRDLDAVPASDDGHRRDIFCGSLSYDDGTEGRLEGLSAEEVGQFLKISAQTVQAQLDLNRAYRKRDQARANAIQKSKAYELPADGRCCRDGSDLVNAERVCLQRQEHMDSHVRNLISLKRWHSGYQGHAHVHDREQSVDEMTQYVSEVQRYLARVKQLGPQLVYSGSDSSAPSGDANRRDASPNMPPQKRHHPKDHESILSIRKRIHRCTDSVDDMEVDLLTRDQSRRRSSSTTATMIKKAKLLSEESAASTVKASVQQDQELKKMNSQMRGAIDELAQLKQKGAQQATQMAELLAEHRRLAEAPEAPEANDCAPLAKAQLDAFMAKLCQHTDEVCAQFPREEEALEKIILMTVGQAVQTMNKVGVTPMIH